MTNEKDLENYSNSDLKTKKKSIPKPINNQNSLNDNVFMARKDKFASDKDVNNKNLNIKTDNKHSKHTSTNSTNLKEKDDKPKRTTLLSKYDFSLLNKYKDDPFTDNNYKKETKSNTTKVTISENYTINSLTKKNNNKNTGLGNKETQLKKTKLIHFNVLNEISINYNGDSNKEYDTISPVCKNEMVMSFYSHRKVKSIVQRICQIYQN